MSYLAVHVGDALFYLTVGDALFYLTVGDALFYLTVGDVVLPGSRLCIVLPTGSCTRRCIVFPICATLSYLAVGYASSYLAVGYALLPSCK